MGLAVLVVAVWLVRVHAAGGEGRSSVTRDTQPGCHIPWTLLAGIGSVESAHGGSLRPDGTTTRRILGPPLDGSGGNIAIPASPEGRRLDGDPRWDHAVGPMQFIPSTWTAWAASPSDGRANAYARASLG